MYSFQIQSILEETLQAVGAKAMVVGHTPQTTGANWLETTFSCQTVSSLHFRA